MSDESEKKLLARCRRYDDEAWDELFDRHYAAAARFVFQLGSDFTRDDVEDICQETFLSVIKHFGSFRGTCQFQTWLFRIAANKARDYRQRQRAGKRGAGQTPVSLQAADPASGAVIDPPSPAPTPDLELMADEKLLLVREAVDQLEPPCREIVELRYFGDLSYEELGAILDLNEKTVSSRLSRCLDHLEAVARRIFSAEQSGILPSNS